MSRSCCRSHSCFFSVNVKGAFRGFKVRTQLVQHSQACIHVQRIVRGFLARSVFARMKRKRAVARFRLQAFARMCVTRLRFLRLRWAVVQLQAKLRSMINKHRLVRIKGCVVKLQSAARLVWLSSPRCVCTFVSMVCVCVRVCFGPGPESTASVD